VDRLEVDMKEKVEHVERLEKDREAANLKIVEMQTRMDCKEQQHSQVLISYTYIFI